ncbi:MAG: hypothetical protein IRY94_16890 [Rhodospirillaceae bacterium]|nr:hypothetical protein [Rhodospirillaceae bacterium]
MVFVSLALAACGFDGKYENQNFLFDNNCSGTGGYYDAARCADYINAGNGTPGYTP